MAPNNTAWCKATERFLDKMGYKLPSEGSLRKRFSNALVWYNCLKDQVTNYVQSSIGRARQSLLNLNDGVDVSTEFEEPDPFSSPIERLADLPLPDEGTEDAPAQDQDYLLPGDGDDAEDVNPFPDALPRVRPSDYLRSRCALCFGGLLFQNRRQSSTDPPDAIVCIDACFTQKHNRQAYDNPPLTHPRSVFLSKDQVNATKKYVDTLRPMNAKPAKRPRVEQDQGDDRFEHTLRVPRSVLDGCEESFTAADARRVKASTQFFDDTALMGLLWRSP
ncbi:hypothetical protein H0H92_009664, partial [Tricholoma furcatifolium]